MHKIYQLDYSRNKKEYRMLEHFLPTVGPGREITLPLYVHELIPLVINVQETQDRPSATKANKVLPIGTGAWSPEVGIQRVVWNTGNGLGGAPLLASSTGSGLCRIDWLLGRWMRERIPYYGIEGIRQEVDDRDVMDEDSE